MKKVLFIISIAILASVLTSNLVSAETGGVSASGTNNAKITVTIADGTSDFGTNLDPEGTDSNSSDTVADQQGSTGNQGSYYVWSAAGSGLSVEVKSNKVWSGTVEASENAGTSTSMSISGGVMTYAESAPASYSDCSSATAFTTTAASWKTSVAKGKNTYTHYYCLRVDWDDDPGTFSSSVTYTATQS